MNLKRISRRVRFWTWIVQASIRRYFLRIIGILIILILVFLGASRIAPALRFLSAYKHGLVGVYSLENLPSSVMAIASHGLTYVDEHQEVHADLADNWTVDDSGKKFTFKLKDNLRWQDGSRLRSSDLRFNFPEVIVGYPDDKTVVFILKDPISSFPAATSRPIFKNNTFIGNGDYKITSVERINDLVKSITFTPVSPRFKRIVVNFYPNQSKLTQAIQIGEISGATMEDDSTFGGWPNLSIEKRIDSNHFMAIYYNTKDAFLSGKDARQALTYAINYQNLGGQRAFGPIPPTSWAAKDNTKKYDFDAQKTKDLLANMQYTGSRKVELTTLANFEDIAGKVATYWRAAGVDTTVKVVHTKPAQFQAFLAFQEIPNDPDQYTLWHSTQGGAALGLKDAKIDKFLEDGRVTFDKDERRIKYLDFQRVLVDDTVATFLYYPSADIVYNKSHTKDVELIKTLHAIF